VRQPVERLDRGNDDQEEIKPGRRGARTGTGGAPDMVVAVFIFDRNQLGEYPKSPVGLKGARNGSMAD
jgi:hypothetical protein